MEQINVDLIPGKVLQVCHSSQYDVGRTIRVNLFEGGQVFTFDGTQSAQLKVRKTDGNVVTAALTATMGNSYVEIETTQQMTACAGLNMCDIVIIDSSNSISTANFVLSVEEDPLDGGVNSQSEIHDLQAQVNAAVQNSAEIVRINDNFARFNAINLIDTRALGTHTTSGDITFAFNADGKTCTVTGTASSNTFYNMYFNQSGFPENMQAGGTYYIKMSGVNVYFWVYSYKGGYTSLIKTKTDAAFTIPNDADGIVIRLSVDKNAVVNETVTFALLNTQSNQDLTARQDAIEPIVLTDHKDLTRFNAISLLDTSGFGTYTTGGHITFNFNTDGKTCAVSGTATSNTFYNLFINNAGFPAGVSAGGTYYVEFSGVNVWYYVYYYDQNATPHLIIATKESTAFTIPSDAAGLILRLYVANGTTVSETVPLAFISAWSNKTLSATVDYLNDTVKPAINPVVFENMDRKNSDNSTKLTRRGGIDVEDVLTMMTWETGNITASGTETSNNNYIRSNYLKTDSGDSFFAQYASSTPSYELRFFYYDNAQNFVGFLTGHTAFSGDITDQTYATPGEGYIRFVVFKTPADTYTIDPADISNVDFTLKRMSFKNAEIIRVGTNNVRNWGTEHNYGYTGDFEQNAEFYRELYSKVQPTYLGVQEFSPYLDAPHQHPAAALFRNLFIDLYHSTAPRLPVFSNLPLTNFTAGKTTTGRNYATAEFTAEDGKTITILNFHAYPGLTPEAISNRQTEFGELLTLLTGKSFIINGDLNTTTVDELDIFKTAGCNVANGGDFGTFYTGESAGVVYPLDNVVTSSDLKIQSVGVADSSGTSDHKMLYADVII